jgi:hypothetical protein
MNGLRSNKPLIFEKITMGLIKKVFELFGNEEVDATSSSRTINNSERLSSRQNEIMNLVVNTFKKTNKDQHEANRRFRCTFSNPEYFQRRD